MGLAIWVYFSLLRLGFCPYLALVVELLFLILRVWQGSRGILEVVACQLGNLFVALLCLRLLPRLGMLLVVEELIEGLVVVTGLEMVNGKVLARG
jgi:hypothetical protein